MSATIASRNKASGWSRHSIAPASRALTLIFPAPPCRRLTEKSSAWTWAGMKRVTREAGSAKITTADTTIRPRRMSGQRRAGGGRLLSRLAERDAGIDQSGCRRAIDTDRFDGKTEAPIQRIEPAHQGVERRGFQLHANATRRVGLRSAQRTAQSHLACDPINQHDRRLVGDGGNLAAACPDLGRIRVHPRQILTSGGASLDRARDGCLQWQQNSADHDDQSQGDGTQRNHTLLALLQARIPCF